MTTTVTTLADETELADIITRATAAGTTAAGTDDFCADCNNLIDPERIGTDYYDEDGSPAYLCPSCWGSTADLICDGCAHRVETAMTHGDDDLCADCELTARAAGLLVVPDPELDREIAALADTLADRQRDLAVRETIATGRHTDPACAFCGEPLRAGNRTGACLPCDMAGELAAYWHNAS